ncbi:hypothetical protein ACFQX7_38790 [Luedemannella flava]
MGSLTVVEALDEVIGWHRDGLLPFATPVTADRRSRLVHGDFFAMSHGAGFDPDHAGRLFHVIAVDIDHSPQHVLHPSHAGFYTADGLRHLTRHLHPGGVFARGPTTHPTPRSWPPSSRCSSALPRMSSPSPTRSAAASPPTPSTWPRHRRAAQGGTATQVRAGVADLTLAVSVPPVTASV